MTGNIDSGRRSSPFPSDSTSGSGKENNVESKIHSAPNGRTSSRRESVESDKVTTPATEAISGSSSISPVNSEDAIKAERLQISEGDLQQVIDQIQLKTISKTIKETKKEVPETPLVRLPLIAHTANPVTKIEPNTPLALSESDVNRVSETPITWGELTTLLEKLFRDFKAKKYGVMDKYKGDSEEVKALNEQYQVVKLAIDEELFDKNGILLDKDASCSAQFAKIMAKIDDILKNNDFSEGKILQETVEYLKENLDAFGPHHLAEIPKRYDRNEILSNLRIINAYVDKWPTILRDLPSGKEFAKVYDRLMNDIVIAIEESSEYETVPGYFDSQFVERIVNLPGWEKIPNAKKYLDFLTKNAGPRFLSYDLKVRFGENPIVMGRVKDFRSLNIEKWTSQQFAIKPIEGEGMREVLMGKLAKIAGLNQFLVRKEPVDLQGTKLGDYQNPIGIASRWMPGKTFNGAEWRKWLSTRHRYVMDSLRNKAVVEHSRGKLPARKLDRVLEVSYQEQKNELLKTTAQESIGTHILFDALFGCSDSHDAQFKFGEDGELYNFDCARFMTSSPVVWSGKRENADFLFLYRSALLAHPIAEVPIKDLYPEEEGELQVKLAKIREKILSIDGEALVEEWKKAGLIGDKETYMQAGNQVVFLNNLIYTIETSDHSMLHQMAELKKVPFDKKVKDNVLLEALLRQAAAELGVVIDPALSKMSPESQLAVIKMQVMIEAEKKILEIRDKCWEQVEPNAVDQFLKRLTNIQTYFKEAQNPTLLEAVYAAYPIEAPFLKASAILHEGLGEDHFVNVVNDRVLPKSLEEVYGEAVKHKNLLGSNYEALLDEMKESLDSLKQKVENNDPEIFSLLRGKLSNFY